MPADQRLPLFLLPLSALPGEEVPLHVFEPRYRALVRYCLDEESEFGVLFVDEEGVREVGCAVRIDRITQEHDDGRVDILTHGTRRFQLAGEVEEALFPEAPVTWVVDDPVGPHEDDEDDDATTLFAELAQRVTGSIPDLGSEGEASFRIASHVAFGASAKQGLLELRSERARLELLARLLRAAIARLSQVELRQATARSNGKVHFE
ncbi:MAG: LON peptidase substrate-binding domain-containing protein [Solirubrobacteraceae bacterium]|nr:LON peptidase substrate-binding domain-containing protein [Solirubrobacteraceae bacterium]